MSDRHAEIRKRLADHVAATALHLGLLIGPGITPAAAATAPDGKRRYWLSAWREVDASDRGALLRAADDLLALIVSEHGPGTVWPFSDVPLLHFIEPDPGTGEIVLGGKMRVRTMYVHENQAEGAP